MRLTTKQLAAWQRNGTLVVPNVFSEEETGPALEAIERNAYQGLRYAEYRTKWEAQPEALKRAYEKTDAMQQLAGPFGQALHFPTGLAAVDKLLENETYLGIARELLGAEEIRLGYGQIFLREGLTDSRHSEHPWQGYHIDNATNSALPPHPDWQRYGYILSGIILHDIELDGAPMLVCPGSQDQLATIWEKYPGRAGGMGIPDLREFEGELSDPIPVTAKTGSVAFRSSYLVHAAQPFKNKSKQRAWMGYHFHRAENADWCKTTRPVPGWSSPQYVEFIGQTTPAVRRVLGWPAPGDAYWTRETLTRLAHAYPSIDLTPYEQ